MFRIDTKVQGLLASAAACLALFVAGSASAAQQVYLKTDGIYNPGQAHIQTPARATVGFDEQVYSGPVWFEADLGTGAGGPEFDFLGFCVDIYHNINAGINGQANLDRQYTQQSTLYNGDGAQITGGTLTQITNLVGIGTQLWNAAGSPHHNGGVSGLLSNQLAAIQEDIWTLEGGHVTGGNALESSFLTQSLSTSLRPTHLAVVYNYNPTLTAAATLGQTQSFAFAVPEPASWTMMILGFGGIGATLRRRRTAAALA